MLSILAISLFVIGVISSAILLFTHNDGPYLVGGMVIFFALIIVSPWFSIIGFILYTIIVLNAFVEVRNFFINRKNY